jgi:2-polyprenyl-6-methoxyphenol hydroxylase-like FAD-dependent oxidoreductase
METKDIHTQCCIAGGGPAGILLGYLLARAGIEVVVLEKWPDFFRDFRGDTIHPSTLEALHELGLLEDFLKLPHNKMERMTLNIGTKRITVADLRHLHTRCPYIAFIPQWDFLNFLAEKARAFPTFHLHMATEAVDLITEAGKTVGVKAKNADGEFSIHAPLTIGADGRHSTIRKKGGFAVDELGVPIDVLWFRIARTDKDQLESLGYIDNGQALVMLDRREYWQCALIIQKGAFDTLKAQGLETFRASIASLAHLDPQALEEVDSWDKVKLLSVSVDHASVWAKEGVAIIGDAAHAMSPIGGVGINYAVQDAIAAANILVPAFKEHTVSLETVRKIQTRRSKPTLRMQRMQVFLQDNLFKPLLEKRKTTEQLWYLNLFNWIPFLRRIPARIIGIGFLPEHIETKQYDASA